MKKIFSLLIIFIMLFCGCTNPDYDTPSAKGTQQNPIIEIDMESDFSYKEDLATYSKNETGVKTNGFVCTTPSPVDTPEQAIELAKKEVTVDYDIIYVSYDKITKIYRVTFAKEIYFGGEQSVYINQNGIRVYMVYGE